MTGIQVKQRMIAAMQSDKIQLQIEKEKAYPNGYPLPKVRSAIGQLTRKINILKKELAYEQNGGSDLRPSVKDEYKADGRKRTTACPFCLRESDN